MSSTALNAESSNQSSSSPQTQSDPRYGLRVDLSQHYFFLTIPGVIRLLEALLSSINVGSFAYFCTFYKDDIKEAVPPVFLATTREAFFMFTNVNTLLTSVFICVACMISVRSHASLLESLFMFVFDFVQFFLILSSSVGIATLYAKKEAYKYYEQSLQARRGILVTGFLLAFLHLLGCIYDLGIYIGRTRSVTLLENQRLQNNREGTSDDG